jgi:predicted nucleotidyltransferase
VSRSLLHDVTVVLDGAGVRYALAGAAALAVHGIARSTFDLDLFTTDAVALDRTTWTTLATNASVRVDIRRGDADDPLAGVVRIESEDERDVDVVVGRSPWQTEIVSRARPITAAGVQLPVVGPSDLILLKLYAGGSQDCWDIEQLLAGDARQRLVDDVEAQLDRLPGECRRLWVRIVGAE